MSFKVQDKGFARGRGRWMEGNSRFVVAIDAVKEVHSGGKQPMFIVEFTLVDADAHKGISNRDIVPYRKGEAISWVCGVPPFPNGEQVQAEQINAFLCAAVGCDQDTYAPYAQRVLDAALSQDNILEGRVVVCSTLEREQRTPGKYFTDRNFSPYDYPPGEAPVGLPDLLTRKGAPAQRPAAPPMSAAPAGAALPPPPPPEGNPWDTLPASYHRPPSKEHPRGAYWNGSAFVSK